MIRFPRLSACVLAGLVLTSAPAHAQEFTWTESNSFQLSNVPGLVARMMGSGRETTETSYLSGRRMRTESGNSATMIDLDAGHIITLDTKAKTYTRMTFDELAAMMREAAAEAEAQAAAERGRPRRGEEPQYDVRFDAAVDVTAEQQSIAGYDARRSLIHVTVTAVPKDEQQRREMGESGSLAFLIDSWNSDAAPHDAALKDFQRAYADRLAVELDRMQSMEVLFAQHPGMKEGWAAAMKELQKVEGVPVRSTTYIISVPAGLTFDRQLVLSPPDEQKEGAGARVGRGIAGRLRAAAGQQQAAGEETAAPKQNTIISVNSELREVRAGGVPANAWEVPAGYREVKPKK